MKKMRLFLAVFMGNLVFFSMYAAAAWLFALLDMTPYGRFVNAFYRGRTAEEASAFMEANRVLFDVMLKDAAFFSSVVISPVVGLAAGFVAGAILHANSRAALLWSVLTVVPVSALLLVKSSGDPLRALYFFMLVAAAALGGYLGSAALNKNLWRKTDVLS